MKNMIKKFLSRAIIGMLAIVLVNQILAYLGNSVSVGVNVLTCLTSGILGFPGVILLYGIVTL